MKNDNDAILIILQFGTNVGYAIAPLETTFYNMAIKLGYSDKNIHFAYKDMEKGKPQSLPDSFTNVIAFDTKSINKSIIDDVCQYIKKNNIRTIFGFDLPPKRKFYKSVRKAGIDKIISYYGAPMSSINNGFKFLLKRLEMLFNIFGPDHYMFESNAMRDTAIYGRGVNKKITSVVNLGVDEKKYSPETLPELSVYDVFDIPKDRKIIFYSGHMQKRKGVHILVDALKELVNNRGHVDVHLLIFGNKEGEIEWLQERYRGSPAEDFVTFGGYRTDLHEIMPQCYVGAIASNGWDSFPRSAIEMQACGLPLLVSRFQGLVETIEEEVSGKLFEPGNAVDLADKIEFFLSDENMRNNFSKNARERVDKSYTLSIQLENLVRIIRNLIVNK